MSETVRELCDDLEYLQGSGNGGGAVELWGEEVDMREYAAKIIAAHEREIAQTKNDLQRVLACDVIEWAGENPWTSDGNTVLNAKGEQVAVAVTPDGAIGIANCHNAVIEAKKKHEPDNQAGFHPVNFGNRHFSISYHLLATNIMDSPSEVFRQREFDCDCRSEIDAFNLLNDNERYQPLVIDSIIQS